MRAPLAPSGWPIAIAPPLTLSLRVELGPARQAGERLGGERLVELRDDDVVPADPRPLERAVRGLDRRDPEHVGVDAGAAAPGDPRQRLAADRRAGRLVADQQRARRRR